MTLAVQKDFVVFLSPGTFVSETSEQPIDSWDPTKAVKMADQVTERHDATPYGFYFVTRGRGAEDLDSKEIRRSGTYFLGGTILTLADVVRRNDPKDEILISNMRGNGFERIIENTNSWKACLPFEKRDTLLEYTPPAKRKEAVSK